MNEEQRQARALAFRDWANERIKVVSAQRGRKLKIIELARQVNLEGNIKTSSPYLCLLLRTQGKTKPRVPEFNTAMALGIALGDIEGALTSAFGPVPGMIRGSNGQRIAEVINTMDEKKKQALLTLLEDSDSLYSGPTTHR